VKNGTPWEERAWVPVVGMKIRYRRDTMEGQVNPHVVATILSVGANGTLSVERSVGRKNVSLSTHTWKVNWEPIPATMIAPVITSITEDDVRRIVREELAARANKVESALRSLMDELFDTVG